MSQSLGFSLLIDKRVAQLFKRFFDDKDLERHDFLQKLEMVRDSIVMHQKEQMKPKLDEHEDYLGTC
jgi:hypothetical protein